MTADPKSVAIEYIQAVGDKDFDRLDALLHPDLEGWTGGQKFDRAAWAQALRNFGPILIRNEIRKTIVDRDQVCIVYDFITNTPVGVVPCAEIVTVEGGLIREARLVFEFARWPEVMAELRKRATA